jgi:hypothetical protein
MMYIAMYLFTQSAVGDSAMTQAITVHKSTRRRMVRKQIYILPHQEARLKVLAQEQLVTEANLIRQAVEAFLNQPTKEILKPLPPDDAAWQEILASFAEVRSRTVAGEPHRWTRDDYYDDPRHQ